MQPALDVKTTSARNSAAAPPTRLDWARAALEKYIDLLLMAGLALLAGWTLLQFDMTQQPLPGDTTYHIYAAQQMLEGHPIYRDVTIVKTPLADFMTLFALLAGRAFGLDDIVSARLMFFLLTLASVLVVYLAGRDLLSSRAAGVIAALVVAGNDFYGIRALTGPEPKTLVGLFSMAALVLIARRAWFWAGVSAALAALAWQPAALTMAIVLLAALLAPQEEKISWRTRARYAAPLRALFGMLLPIFALLLYLGAYDALRAAYGATIGANLSHLGNQTAQTPFNELVEWNAHWVAYNIDLYCMTAVERWQLVFGVVGFVGIVASEIYRIARAKRWEFNVKRAPLILYTVGFAAFTLVDFNWCPDLYPFLPVLGLGIGWCVAQLAEGARRVISKTNPRYGAWTAFGIVALAATAILYMNLLDVLTYKRQGIAYRDQRALVRQVRARFKPGDRILSIGNALILVEMRLPNASKIIHFGSKAGRGVLENEPGGMEGWLASLAANPPRLITLSRAPRADWNEDFYAWLDENYRRVIQDKYNAVDVYILRPRD